MNNPIKPLIILKVGGSAIAHKHREIPTANMENIKRIAKEIKNGFEPKRNNMLLIHGVGSFGHPIAKQYGLKDGIKTEKQTFGFAETQKLQNELNIIVTEALLNEGLPAIPCQASSFTVMTSKRISEMSITAVKGLLNLGLIPVFFGVPAFDTEQGCSILSGDQILSYLAKHLNPVKLLHGTDVDGIFDDNPQLNPDAKFIEKVDRNNYNDILEMTGKTRVTDVSGGIKQKLEELMSIAKDGIDSQIVNANVEGNLTRALKGEKLGTIVTY